MIRILFILSFFVAGLSAKMIAEAGWGYNYYRYSEPGVMKIQGNLHSVFAKLSYLGSNSGVEANFSHNFDVNTKYFGSTMSGTPLDSIPSKDTFWDADVRFGKRMNFLAKNYDGLAYIGFGYRYLKNKVSNQGGYTREQIYYYVPMGFYAIDKMLLENLFARYGIEFRYAFLGTNKSHIGEVNPSFNPRVLHFTQKHNFGLKVYTGFEYRISGSFGVFIQTSADYWYVKKSSSARANWIDSNQQYQGEFIEPNNNTIKIGIEVGARF